MDKLREGLDAWRKGKTTIRGREAKRNQERLHFKFIVNYVKELHPEIFTKAAELYDEIKENNPNVYDLTKTVQFMSRVTPGKPIPRYYYQRQTYGQQQQQHMVLQIPLLRPDQLSATVPQLAAPSPQLPEPQLPGPQPQLAAPSPQLPEPQLPGPQPQLAAPSPQLPEPQLPGPQPQFAAPSPQLPEPQLPGPQLQFAAPSPQLPEPQLPGPQPQFAATSPQLPEPQLPGPQPQLAAPAPQLPESQPQLPEPQSQLPEPSPLLLSPDVYMDMLSEIQRDPELDQIFNTLIHDDDDDTMNELIWNNIYSPNDMTPLEKDISNIF